MGPEARRLPDTLTELIEHALASASTLDRNRYTPHQAAYLTHRGKDRPALVGAAGMLIAGDLRLSTHKDWRAELDTETWNKVCAVDATEYAFFDDALSLTHRLGLKKMPEAELLQSKVNHTVMTAIGRAMSRHGNVFQALRQAASGARLHRLGRLAARSQQAARRHPCDPGNGDLAGGRQRPRRAIDSSRRTAGRPRRRLT